MIFGFKKILLRRHRGNMTFRISHSLLLFTFALSVSIAAHAQGTKIWSQSTETDWERGTPSGVAIDSSGVLSSTSIAETVATTPSAYVWSVAVDTKGNAYVGTGSPASVLKITPDGKSTTLMETKDLSVQSVQLGPDGMLYAATLPQGKVYRLDPRNEKAAPQVIFDSSAIGEKPQYIWDLAFDKEGALYIATGAPAAIYRVEIKRSDAKPTIFLTSDEQNIRCLLFGKDGNLYAASNGRGLVYRVAPDGSSFVMFEAPQREITALAFDPDGNLYLSALGQKHAANLPPLVSAPSAGPATPIKIVSPGSIQSSKDSALLPDGTTIYQLAANGAPRQLWASRHDVIYSLDWIGSGNNGALLAASGNQGHLYRIAADGTYADIAHLEARQATALAQQSNGTEWIVTSNTGKLYRLNAAPENKAKPTYTSEIFDARFFSRWGRATVRGAGSYQLQARSGNVEQPEQGWSKWTAITPNAAAMPIPQARFVQWRATLTPDAHIEQMEIAYLPQNVAPAVDAVAVQLHARMPDPGNAQPSTTVSIPLQGAVAATNSTTIFFPSSGALTAQRAQNWGTVRWQAHDDNGDQLRYRVLYRAEDEADWRTLIKNINGEYASFDLQQLPDGWYRLRVEASDAPSHPSGEALTAYKDSAPFLIDTTAPVLSGITASAESDSIHIIFDAKDALSRIARASASVDGGKWIFIEPVGKLSDAPQEHYDLKLPLPKENAAQHVVAVRVYDSAGNMAIGKAEVLK